MSVGLLLAVLGLALLDSLNPATLVAVTLILLGAPRRPGLAVVVGAACTVFTLGAVLFLTAGAAAAVIDGVLYALRFVAFGAAALALIVAGIRRFRERRRKPIVLPSWVTPWTAIGFGVLITAADLPNAFPYFIAIERLVVADVSTGVGLLVVAGYSLVYCLPCLVLLVVGLLARERVTRRLRGFVDRFGTGTVRRSIPIGVTWILAGIAVGTIPFWVG